MTRARRSGAFAISALIVIAAAAACSRSPTPPSPPVALAAATLTIRLADPCPTAGMLSGQNARDRTGSASGFSGTFDAIVTVTHFIFSRGDRCNAAGISYVLTSGDIQRSNAIRRRMRNQLTADDHFSDGSGLRQHSVTVGLDC